MNVTASLSNSEDVELAKLASQELSAIVETNGAGQSVSVVDKSGVMHEVNIPVSAWNLIIEVLTQLGNGNSVSITPIQAELTTQEGADMLNMSRPSFIKLLDSEAIPYSRTGNRRKISFIELHNYKNRQEAARLATLAELSVLDQKLDMGY